MVKWIVCIFIFVFGACPAIAQELHLFGGLVEGDGNNRNFAWQLDYREGLGEQYAISFSYLNEGHLPDHHRDGHGAQLWAGVNVLDRRLSLSVGVGPYFYYDTTTFSDGNKNQLDHGWGALSSLAATWYTESRWLFQLRTNWVVARNSFDTASALVGIGYQLEAPPTPGPFAKALPYPNKTTNNELTVFLGETSAHNSGSRHSFATSLEYRRGLWRYLDWTIAWLYEGENELIRRHGMATQLWAVRGFHDSRLTLGAGGGAYIAEDRLRDRQNNDGSNFIVAGIVTMTSSFRFNPQWGIRVSWNRILTDYNRDSDVIMAGIGHYF